jgi:hypothetical protein
LYTLNALNKLIKSTIPDYDEILSNNKVEWENHRNTLLIIRDNELKTLPIKISKIYK